MASRDGDANMRSVRVCLRNDVIANLEILLAALGVFGAGTGWPDFGVTSLMALLARQREALILREAARD
ncbi:hypothetical protein CN97_11770 [Haematobacter massiliensis]|uniref:Uncharacterized protein n=1 Tax=Haematobacter massiliensis TaxID=195105 RepID=A0A086Y8R5_9RHOB|nr:hypothetical protein [Haematobacter massiliensis]KFI30665.1 hypothetical protein CN97_11770 [Haematobacter massiliensis]